MEAHAQLARRLDLAVDVVAVLEHELWSKTVVQPDCASSASPIRVLAREASASVRAQAR